MKIIKNYIYLGITMRMISNYSYLKQVDVS